jgi:NAD(P)-dependent dehydrogenase (short-subunit alcohol dehydrogenase family)
VRPLAPPPHDPRSGAPAPGDGLVAVVTGPTSGIGAETALGLARRGAVVVLVARNPEKGRRIARQVERSTGAGRTRLVVADLSSQPRIRDAAAEILRSFPRVDLLVNNAGAYFARRETSADGIELNLAVNHLAPFALSLRLMGALARSAAGRIVNVSSAAHRTATLDLDDMQSARRYDRLEAYARSKLANLLFTYELARRLAGTRITVNAVDPGAVATNLGAGWLRTRVRNLVRRSSMLSAAEGARTSLHVATAPELAGRSGSYFFRCEPARSSEASYDLGAAARVWELSEELTGLRWRDVVT